MGDPSSFSSSMVRALSVEIPGGQQQQHVVPHVVPMSSFNDRKLHPHGNWLLLAKQIGVALMEVVSSFKS